MIISDLNYLEILPEAVAVQGGWKKKDTVSIKFNTTNKSTLNISSPSLSDGNYASAGAKAVADPGIYGETLNSFTMANTLAVVTYGGGSFSASTSVAAISA